MIVQTLGSVLVLMICVGALATQLFTIYPIWYINWALSLKVTIAFNLMITSFFSAAMWAIWW